MRNPFNRLQRVARENVNIAGNNVASKKITIENNTNLDANFKNSNTLNDNIITIIFAKYTPVHLETVYSYALCSVINPKIKKVNIIVTDEWRPFYKNNGVTPIKKIKDELEALFAKSDGIDSNVFDKINVARAHKVKDLESKLEGVVLRFVGASAEFSSYIFSRDIYKAFPTICATFSQKVEDSVYRDVHISSSREDLAKGLLAYNPPSVASNDKSQQLQVINGKADELKKIIDVAKDKFKERSGKQDVIIFGDSHSENFALNDQIKTVVPGINLFRFDINVTYGSSLVGIGRKKSTLNIRSRVYNKVKETKPDTVVLAFGQVDIELGLYFRKYVKKQKLTIEQYFEDLISSYIEFINHLPIENNRVVVKGINLPVLCYDDEKWAKYTSRIISENKSLIDDVGIVETKMYSEMFSDHERTKQALLFNDNLRKRLEKVDVKYYDISQETINVSTGLIDDDYIPIGFDHHIIKSLKVSKLYWNGLINAINFGLSRN
ncbi:hypothetical protein [Ferrimonas marina]|uniref:GDSL-like Lipase/Acylhydrolase n=1 Tax=Ferrimonas marina TaxID=299255 RepID=A0A1M5VK17_9GAMM|nr:hypothetical protein [Ferrimonas marina]SHH75547.1 GDSL-like Lipase/Acylhydrolase [Ferrimonas marina]